MPTVNIANSTNSVNARVTPWGNLQIAQEGQAIFTEPFDGTTLDTLDRWAVPVTSGAGAVVLGGGLCTLSVGTGASSAVALGSIDKFIGVGASFLQMATLLQMEPGVGGLLPLNVNAFWGQGTPNASYTAATPLQDAIGFERTLDGKFSAVLYTSASRMVIRDLTNFVQDGAPHLVACAIRGDTKYFFLDNLEIPVAAVTYFSPTFMNLPIRFHAVNHTTPPAVAPTVRSTGIQVLDSGGGYVCGFNGNTVLRARTPTVFKQINAVSVATEVTIWAPVAGKKFRLMGFALTSGMVGGNVLLKDNTAGATIMIVPFGAAGSQITSPAMGNGVLSATANNVLTATGVATQTLSGFVFGTEE